MTNYHISINSAAYRATHRTTESTADQIARLERRAAAIADRWPVEAAEARAQAAKLREAN